MDQRLHIFFFFFLILATLFIYSPLISTFMASPRYYSFVFYVLLRLLAVSSRPFDRVAPPPLRLHLRRLLTEPAARDVHRRQTHHGRRQVRRATAEASLSSGLSLGSGEYLADVFVGTPAQRFSVIVDTGSDLNWLQCAPCHNCFEQSGPLYDPALSSSYRPVPPADPRCTFVSSDDRVCAYNYSYDDRSYTSGELALDTFSLNLTTRQSRRHEGVVFGCGRQNQGLFRGAAGLLGLGRGPLSFFSQLRQVYGGVFSYCLVPRDSDPSVTGRLIFGKDPRMLNLSYTAFARSTSETFYYVDMQGVKVGGRRLEVPPEAWAVNAAGTIIDSGSTLSYLPRPAYQAIQAAVRKQVRYPVVEGVPVLSPCFNVSGTGAELPELTILFGDGAEWRIPPENYFVTLGEGAEVACLALLPTPSTSSFAILGNYLQQNFLVVYDVDRSRLGFAPADCARL